VVAALGATVVCAQAPPSGDIQALQKEVEALRQTQLAIQKDVQEIKAILTKLLTPPQAQAPAVDTKLPLADATTRGNSAAKVAIVEFSDFQCPFCGRYATQTFPQIDKEYIAAGKVRYAFMDFPIESIHPQAFKAHEAALCAGEQGKFWEMHRELFANQNALAADALAGHAAKAGADQAKVAACLQSGRHAESIRKDLAMGEDIGVRGTPTVLIGTAGPDGTFTAARVISGAQPFSVFKDAIEQILKTQAQ
jgi:protein-disulfide isomerase